MFSRNLHWTWKINKFVVKHRQRRSGYTKYFHVAFIFEIYDRLRFLSGSVLIDARFINYIFVLEAENQLVRKQSVHFFSLVRFLFNDIDYKNFFQFNESVEPCRKI